MAAEQVLVFEVWDAAAAGGRGACLGTGVLAVPVRSLQHRDERAAEVACQPAPAAGGPAAAGQDRQQQQPGVRLQVAYALQRQWSFAKSAGSPPGPEPLSADLSTAGQRALSLATQPGAWAVVPAFGQQRGLGSAAKGSKAGSAGGAFSCSHLVLVGEARDGRGPRLLTLPVERPLPASPLALLAALPTL